MANGIDWFRWHHGTAADPKFGLVAKKAGARFGDVVTVWALILEQASANLDRGAFGPLDCETTDFLLGAEDGTTARILAAMDDRDLTGGGRVVRWDKRQPKRERETPDTSTARVQKLRAKASDKDGVTADETPCNATERQETPREEKSREEERRVEATTHAADGSTASDFDPPKAAPLPMRELPPVSDDPAVQLAVALRRQGITANSAHPAVQGWAAKGVTIDQITEAVAIARTNKPDGQIPANYLAPIVNDLLNPPAAKPRPAGQGRAAPQSSKFHFGDIDRSGDVAAMAANMQRRGITVPEGDEVIEL